MTNYEKGGSETDPYDSFEVNTNTNVCHYLKEFRENICIIVKTKIHVEAVAILGKIEKVVTDGNKRSLLIMVFMINDFRIPMGPQRKVVQ